MDLNKQKEQQNIVSNTNNSLINSNIFLDSTEYHNSFIDFLKEPFKHKNFYFLLINTLFALSFFYIALGYFGKDLLQPKFLIPTDKQAIINTIYFVSAFFLFYGIFNLLQSTYRSTNSKKGFILIIGSSSVIVLTTLYLFILF